jgi:hypothetical protein
LKRKGFRVADLVVLEVALLVAACFGTHCSCVASIVRLEAFAAQSMLGG